MVAVDFHLNETTRHAHFILPPVFAFARDHFDLAFHALAVRNVARYCEPLFRRRPQEREDWQIVLDLAAAIGRRKGGRARLAGLRAAALRRFTPRRLLGLLVRFGPHGASLNPFSGGLTFGRLRAAERTIDLCPLHAGQLPRRLAGHAIELAPAPMLADLARVRRELIEAPPPKGLLLVGRREMRGNNSWLHNARHLAKGPDRCTLAINPYDARRLGIGHGVRVEVRSRAGRVCVPAEIDENIRPGVVSLPHGYGHDRPWTRLGVAALRPGASVNDITDPKLVDALTGTAAFNGLAVDVVASCVGATTAREHTAAAGVDLQE